jgi:hypothetical protein
MRNRVASGTHHIVFLDEVQEPGAVHDGCPVAQHRPAVERPAVEQLRDVHRAARLEAQAGVEPRERGVRVPVLQLRAARAGVAAAAAAAVVAVVVLRSSLVVCRPRRRVRVLHEHALLVLWVLLLLRHMLLLLLLRLRLLLPCLLVEQGPCRGDLREEHLGVLPMQHRGHDERVLRVLRLLSMLRVLSCC